MSEKNMQIVGGNKIIFIVIFGVILLIISGKMFASSIFTKKSEPPKLQADSNPLPHLPYLAESSAKEHEIVRISGYPAGNIRYIKSNNMFIVPTTLRFESWVNLWRVNADGIIVDSFMPEGEYEGSLPNSGIFFRKENYIDWAYTGEKLPKSYSKTLYAKQLDKARIHAVLAEAEQIVWKRNTYYEQIYRGLKETPEIHYFLKNSEGWSLLVASEELTKEEYPELKSALSDDYLDGYEGPELSVTKLSAIDFDVKDPAAPIQLLAFKKIGESKSGFMDINSNAWVGDYGYGHFQLRAGSELVQFKSFHRIIKSYGSEGRNEPDVSLYDATKITGSNNDLKFLILHSGRAPTRDPIELGSYIVRKKITSSMQDKLRPSEISYLKNNQKGVSLAINSSGFEAVQSNLYWVTYFNGASESFGESNSWEIPSASRGIPMELRASFDLPLKPEIKRSDKNSKEKNKVKKPDNRYYSYAVKINDQYFSWSDASDIHFALRFDYDEMVKIITELSSAKQPLVFSLNASFVLNGMEISPLLSNGIKSIAIKKVRFASVAGQELEKEDAVTIFDKKLIENLKTIDEESEVARKDAAKIPATLTLMRNIINASEYPEQFSSSVEHASWFLLNGAIAAKDTQLQLDVVNNYVVNLFPKTGVCPGLDDFVKRAVDIAEDTHNEELIGNISRAFFNPKTRIDYAKSQWLLESGMLDQSFRLAMLNSIYIDDYLWSSNQVLANNMEIKDLAPAIASHYTKLMIKVIAEKKHDIAIKLAINFMNSIYPKTGYSEQSTDVVSHILVIGMVAKNEKILDQVILQFINSQTYNKARNQILYFNMACYYATHADKEKMLAAIKMSRQYGQDNKSFLADKDFNAFKNDPDFIATVNAIPAEGETKK